MRKFPRNNPFLSFIVPVFNGELFVRGCIDSIEHQNIDGRNYEIICINDGSTDGTKEIIENLSKKYKNIVLINQKNSGVCSSRNRGLDVAKGQFVWFVDNDDLILPNILSKICNLLLKNNPDTFAFQYSLIDKNFSLTEPFDFKSLLPKSDGEYIFKNIYRRAFLEEYHIRFIEGLRIFEEEPFNLLIKKYVSNSMKIDECFYLYRLQPNSLTHTYLDDLSRFADGRVRLAEWYRNLYLESRLSYYKKRKRFHTQGAIAFAISTGSVEFVKNIISNLKYKKLYPYYSLNNLVPKLPISRYIKDLFYLLFPCKIYCYFCCLFIKFFMNHKIKK